MNAVSGPLRLAVRQRAQERCEYCLIHDADFLFAHEPDHIIAVQHGGSTAEDNLALARADCNRRKGPNLSSVDPDSNAVVPLFHPRRCPIPHANGWRFSFRTTDFTRKRREAPLLSLSSFRCLL